MQDKIIDLDILDSVLLKEAWSRDEPVPEYVKKRFKTQIVPLLAQARRDDPYIYENIQNIIRGYDIYHAGKNIAELVDSGNSLTTQLVRMLPESTRKAMREIIMESASNASKSITESANEAREACSALSFRGILLGGFLVLVSFVIFGTAYLISSQIVRNRHFELHELQSKITQERTELEKLRMTRNKIIELDKLNAMIAHEESTYEEMRKKTWQIELREVKSDGKLYGEIMLPSYATYYTTNTLKNGREAIYVRFARH